MSSASVVDWRLLAQASPQAHELGAVEARLLARTLAACDVVQDRDGRVADIERRTQDILQTVWPKDPLSGFGLHSSPGAFLVARVAVDLVPARGSLRSEAFGLEALLQNLEELGVEPTTATTVVMPWDGVPEDFKPTSKGLSPSVLAGLAERSLSRAEHGAALDQVAYSPRCLQRLASTINLLWAVKALLPLLPPDDLGDEVWAMTAAVVLGRPDRAAELASQTERLCVRTWQELAGASVALRNGEELPAFENDDLVLPAARAPLSPHEADGLMDDGGETIVADTRDVDDGVLHIEEETDASSGGTDDLEGQEPASMQTEAGPLADRQRVLGLLPGALPESTPAEPMPQDPRLTSALDDAGQKSDHDSTERISVPEVYRVPGLHVDRKPHDAYFPPARAAIRAAVAAVDGVELTQPEEPGHAVWAWSRSRALSLVVQGKLQEAADAVADLPARLAPEGRWAMDLLQRFGDREPEPVSDAERRSMASALLFDVAHQLARTVAGTIERHG